MNPFNKLGGVLGGALGGTTTTVQTTSYPQWSGGSGGPYYSISTAAWTGISTKKIHHELKTAESFKNLTAYLRALMATEKDCECKWCAASELERQMAIAQFFQPEPGEPK